MGKVKVAIAGVGNCANSLIQGVTYYADADANARVPGLMHVELGGISHPRHRVRRRLRRRCRQGGHRSLQGDVGEHERHLPVCRGSGASGIEVMRGPTLDGLGKYYRMTVEESAEEPVDVVQILKDSGADVLVGYLPVGSEFAVRFYADAAIAAGIAYVNAIPVFIASDPVWARKFYDAGVPIIGDDIKSQVGATIVHRQARPPLRGPRGRRRTHEPVECRRQHGLQEHAGTGAPRVEEGLEDAGRHLAVRP